MLMYTEQVFFFLFRTFLLLICLFFVQLYSKPGVPSTQYNKQAATGTAPHACLHVFQMYKY